MDNRAPTCESIPVKIQMPCLNCNQAGLTYILQRYEPMVAQWSTHCQECDADTDFTIGWEESSEDEAPSDG